MSASRPLVHLALVAALAMLAPSAARAQHRRGGGDGPNLRVGGLLGLDRGDFDGIGLRLDGELDVQRLAPKVMLAGVGSLGYSHLSEDLPDLEQRLDLLELVPAARFVLQLAPVAGLYGDAGLGLYTVRFHTKDLTRGVSGDDTDVGLALRFGVGGYVWASDQVRIGAELAFHPHVGDYDDTSATLMLGLAFQAR